MLVVRQAYDPLGPIKPMNKTMKALILPVLVLLLAGGGILFAALVMNPQDPTTVGLETFLIWTALAACLYMATIGLVLLLHVAPEKAYWDRIIVMLILVAVWLMLVPAMGNAFIGNGADPEDAIRRARWQARGFGRSYGADTVWAWCLVLVLQRTKSLRTPAVDCESARGQNEVSPQVRL
jgi:hypothetical protein